PTDQGAIAHQVRIGPVEPASAFGVLDVAGCPQAALDDVARTLCQELAQFLLAEVVLSALADTRRHLAEQTLHELAQVRLDVPVEKVGAHQTHPTVYIVPHAARRNDTPFLRIGGADAAYAEAIAPMDVGHGQAGVLDAGQEGNICYLLRGLVLLELGEE